MYQDYKNVELVKPGGLELKDRLVGVQRVTKVTKGGRTFGFSAIVVVGDENGVVGQGLGKSKDVASAIAKAIEDAKKNLVRIPLNKTTLPHEQKGKYGCARVNLLPRKFIIYTIFCMYRIYIKYSFEGSCWVPFDILGKCKRSNKK